MGICSRGFSGATVQISDQFKHYSLIYGIANVKSTHLGEVTLWEKIRWLVFWGVSGDRGTGHTYLSL